MTLYEKLQADGIPTDNHESDLYFQWSGKAMRIAAEFPVQMRIATTFMSGRDGRLWVDVPFAFDPWWDGKKREVAQ